MVLMWIKWKYEHAWKKKQRKENKGERENSVIHMIKIQGKKSLQQ